MDPMTILSFASAAAPFVSSLFGGKKKGGDTITADQMIPSWQANVGKDLSGFVQKYLANYTPGAEYGGIFTAGPTAQENAGLDKLTGVINGSPTGALFDAAKNQVSKTLAGDYMNPNTNPFIQAMTSLGNQNLQDQINAARAAAGSRGNYFSSGAMKNEDLLRERTLTNLNATIGQALQTERQNQFNAVPVAQTLDQYENLTAPLTQVGASQQYGGLMRTIDQANLEAQYNDFLRQRNELSGVVSTGQGVYGTQQPYGLKSVTSPVTEEPSSLQNILGLVGKLNFGNWQQGGNIWQNIGNIFQPKTA